MFDSHPYQWDCTHQYHIFSSNGTSNITVCREICSLSKLKFCFVKAYLQSVILFACAEHLINSRDSLPLSPSRVCSANQLRGISWYLNCVFRQIGQGHSCPSDSFMIRLAHVSHKLCPQFSINIGGLNCSKHTGQSISIIKISNELKSLALLKHWQK